MTKLKQDFTSKLKKLVEEKQNLILKRKEEIFAIIDKVGCISIDNELLIGSLIIAKEINNKENKINKSIDENLKQFEALLKEKAAKFFRRKQATNNAEKKSNLKANKKNS